MTKRVQLLGHDATTSLAFIGFERELTVDIENDHLHLHDGSTPGGVRILNRDENDNRYQARSVELDGLLGWEPNERGILARKGPSNYSLLTFEADSASLVVTNANGYDGNPTYALAPTITSDHTWEGTHEFTQAVTAPTFVGNLTGNVTGNLTGNVVGNVTGNLTGNANGSHTGTFTGAVVATSITVPAGSIPLSALDGDAIDELNAISTFPGLICMYQGALIDIPPNWALCDGTNGTPDLRGRFIIGAEGSYAQDATGGNTSHSHSVTIDSGGAHTHTGSAGDTALTVAQMPAHKHANGVTDAGTNLFSRGTTAAAMTTPDSIDNNGSSGTIEGWTETVGDGDPHSHSLSIDSGGAHTHTGTADSISHLPPYYALAYVKRIA